MEMLDNISLNLVYQFSLEKILVSKVNVEDKMSGKPHFTYFVLLLPYYTLNASGEWIKHSAASRYLQRTAHVFFLSCY